MEDDIISIYIYVLAQFSASFNSSFLDEGVELQMI